MNGDMECSECGKKIPKAAEYGHMCEVHGWSLNEYNSRRFTRPGDSGDNTIMSFEGYLPILIQKPKHYKRMGLFFGACAIVASFHSLIAVTVVLVVALMILYSDAGGKEGVDDSLNGMIEQLREKALDIEKKKEGGMFLRSEKDGHLINLRYVTRIYYERGDSISEIEDNDLTAITEEEAERTKEIIAERQQRRQGDRYYARLVAMADGGFEYVLCEDRESVVREYVKRFYKILNESGQIVDVDMDDLY